MGRYRFLNATSTATPDTKALANAKAITDLAEIVSANRCAGEYVFTEEKGLAPLFGKILSAEITAETRDNSDAIFNRLVAVTEKAGKQRMRVYGKGKNEVLPAMNLTAEQIAKLTFGFCKSDDEIVTENRLNGSTGEIRKAPVIYANVASL